MALILSAPKSLIDWTTEKTKDLLEASRILITISDVHYLGHTWSIVKLLILSGWVYVYTTIIPKHFKECWYIDLLAGSGTTRVKETGDVVIGRLSSRTSLHITNSQNTFTLKRIVDAVRLCDVEH